VLDAGGERSPVDGRPAPLHRHASRYRPGGRQLAGVALEGVTVFVVQPTPATRGDGMKSLQGDRRPGMWPGGISAARSVPGGNPCRLSSELFQIVRCRSISTTRTVFIC
jgi:hypothetical protein